MVGYHKHDNMSTTQKLLAGCFSGVMTRFITQPLDIIKLRTQVQASKKKKGMTKTARRIFFEEGYKAFWHGHVLGQVHSILAVSSQFYVYELTTKYFGNFDWSHDYRTPVRFFCGVFAGCVSATLVIPFEVIRVRQMVVKEQYSSMWKGGRAVYRYGGILAFYEGLSASLLQMGPQVGISFVVFSHVQPLLLHFLQPSTECKPGMVCEPPPIANRYSPQSLLLASTLAGSLAGIVAKTLTYPLDLAKRRLQLGSHRVSAKYKTSSTTRKLIQCHNLFDCLAKTVRKEGALGLYRGWTITIWKAQITSVVAFTSYELLCYVIREFNVV